MKIIAQEPAQTMQRARVGMIGLAAVLLLIGLAAAIFATISRDRQVAAIGSARPDVVATMVSGNMVDPAKEPLAELGVAPSAVTQASNQNDVAPSKSAATPAR
jgi:hypothetical protein